ncbi:MAG: energy-coupling factor transporter transmembrane protein EcfT [Actinomycetia bacterium]|nr:energy-coupling factor transporter transmembrane protein EcfT [Actinomycetes bacterium]
MTGVADPVDRPRRLPRPVHPVAWWLWALGLAVAASRSTNPLLLALLLAAAGLVVSARRTDAPWARGFRYYLLLALIVIGLRVVFRVVFSTPPLPGEAIAIRLPRIPTPSWYAGAQLGGPVPVSGLLSALTDGMRLATLICCVGAANTLANPKRALRVLPGALYELGVAVVVAISVAPQLIESAQRVARAQRLRGGRGRARAFHALVAPVLQDALERSLALAASMSARGYGRAAADPSAAASPAAAAADGTAAAATVATRANSRRLATAAMLTGLAAVCLGSFGLLGAGVAPAVAYPSLLAGVALCLTGVALGSRRVRHTHYRPDPWRAPEWIAVGCGALCAVAFCVRLGYPMDALDPGFTPPRWPPLPALPALAVLLAALPAIATPPPTAHIGRRAR